MSVITLESAISALSTVQDPDLHKDLITLNMARNIQVLSDNKVKFSLVLTTPACPLKAKIEGDCKEALLKAGASSVEIETTAEVRGFRGLPGKQSISGIAHIIAVSSGKGGVGKSTVSVNLAVSLARLGARVGLLDADITGPNIPLMLGIKEKPSTTIDGKFIVPLEGHGIKAISMGLLIADDEPVVWRGPMLHNAINQFFRDVAWGDLDYLIVDLPPGTSDAQLTISQSVPLSGVLIVSTPQEVALLDSKKGLMMFRQMGVNILGMVENMSYFIAPDTGTHYDIFGHGGAKLVAEKLGIECLGQVPLQIKVREGGDHGTPVCISEPGGEVSRIFAQIAQKVAAQISILNANQMEPAII